MSNLPVNQTGQNECACGYGGLTFHRDGHAYCDLCCHDYGTWSRGEDGWAKIDVPIIGWFS